MVSSLPGAQTLPSFEANIRGEGIPLGLLRDVPQYLLATRLTSPGPTACANGVRATRSQTAGAPMRGAEFIRHSFARRFLSATGITACSQSCLLSLTPAHRGGSVKQDGAPRARAGVPVPAQEKVATAFVGKLSPIRAWRITKASLSKPHRSC